MGAKNLIAAAVTVAIIGGGAAYISSNNEPAVVTADGQRLTAATLAQRAPSGQAEAVRIELGQVYADLLQFGHSTWKLTSAGPDGMHTFGLEAAYDPTNGTTSAGDLILSQAGMETANRN